MSANINDLALTSAVRITDVCNAVLQGRFAEGLASCINSRLGPHEQHEQQQEYERHAAQVKGKMLDCFHLSEDFCEKLLFQCALCVQSIYAVTYAGHIRRT